jgi:excisionase family DNA binding protein
MYNGKNKSKFISVSKAGLELGLNPTTVRRLVDEKIIKSYRTDRGFRRIDKESIQKYIENHSGISNSNDGREVQNFRYARVSSRNQLDDLHRQIEFLNRPEYSNYISIQDVASGLNFKRKGLCTILESAIHGTIGEVVVAHKDRLCRFGFELIEFIVSKGGGKITIIGNESIKSDQEELTEDLLSIVHIFSCRQMGKRKYRRKNINENIENTTKPNEESKDTTE